VLTAQLAAGLPRPILPGSHSPACRTRGLPQAAITSAAAAGPVEASHLLFTAGSFLHYRAV